MRSIKGADLVHCGVNVILLTVIMSSCLAGIFVVSFAMENLRSRRSTPERDSLLPFEHHHPSDEDLRSRHP